MMVLHFEDDMSFGTIEFYGTIEKDRIIFPGEQRRIMKEYLLSAKDGAMCYVRIGRYSSKKTNAQLRAFWGLFIASVLGEFNDRGYDTSYLLKIDKPTGIPISRDLLKEYMYNICPIFDDDERRIGMSSMSVEQMCKFFDDCRNWASTQWNIYVPEPDPNWQDNKNKSILDKQRE